MDLETNQDQARAPPLSEDGAWNIVGGLSKTAKMPCLSWGISAFKCKRGSVLSAIPNTICRACYARKGHYPRPHVQRAHERRLRALNHPRWVDAMVRLIKGQSWFRWFDTGDLQSEGHLAQIVEVCRQTPKCKHWLATREVDFVKAYTNKNELPENLCVRVSGDRIDGPIRELAVPGVASSLVATRKRTDVKNCPASFGSYQERTCDLAKCRSCWDRSVAVVGYRLH